MSGQYHLFQVSETATNIFLGTFDTQEQAIDEAVRLHGRPLQQTIDDNGDVGLFETFTTSKSLDTNHTERIQIKVRYGVFHGNVKWSGKLGEQGLRLSRLEGD